MAIGDGAHQEQKRLATIASLSAAQRSALSGADLMQKAQVVASGLAVGPGNDGARMAQQAGGAGT